jgi:hypothetical protein
VLGPEPAIVAAAQGGQQDARLTQVLPEIARTAATFWREAPDYTARETLNQKALMPPKRRLRVGASAVEAPKPQFTHREIVSYYAFSSFRTTSEALHEFREIVSVDGRAITDADSARAKLRATVNAADDTSKNELLAKFEKSSLAVAATDFGQLVLLFTKPNLGKYTFESRGWALVGADHAMLVDFRQAAGGEALRIAEPGKDVREPLAGQIWIRESGFAPLRISLQNSRRERSKKIRDEARVDYEPKPDGMVLPVSVVYRRFVDEDLTVEAIYEYTDWQRANNK